jgi:hypothetical protein
MNRVLLWQLMGDGGETLLRLRFNPKIQLEFRSATITSDAGLLAFREFEMLWPNC